MEPQNSTEPKTLKEVAEDEVMRQIPLMLYLIILCVSGITGNVLVCYIFTKQYNLTTFRVFVTVLAGVDLFTSGVNIPLELVQFAWQYTYEHVSMCKLNLLLKTWTTLTSGCLLLCIAVDRYRKVCHPLGRQISLRIAKTMCIGSVILAALFSWISPVIYGVQSKTLVINNYNLTISECAITDSMEKTVLPLLNNICFSFLFVMTLCVIITLYALIAHRVKQQMRKNIGSIKPMKISYRKASPRKRSTDTMKTSHEGSTCETSSSLDGSNISSNTRIEDINIDKSEVEKPEHHTALSTKRDEGRKCTVKNRNKITLTMFWISFAFIVSYLPLLCLTLIGFADRSFVPSLSDTERAVYKFFHRSYYLNCAVNPIIYGILDARFRRLCKMVCRCRPRLK